MKPTEAALEVLEKQSSLLDTSPEAFAEWWKTLGAYSASFLSRIEDGPAFHGLKPVASGAAEPSERPEAFASVLADYDRTVLHNGISPTSGRFFGYIPGGGIASAAVGDFVAALTNPYAGAYHACPGAADIENQAVGWLRDLLSFPAESWGTLQSGGSLATLTALVAARAGRPFSEWHRSVVYYTDEAHHCFTKALKIAGLEAAPRRLIQLDDDLRLSVPALERQIVLDRKAGLSPWLVCATAGTTNTGAIDPLKAIAALCKRESLWFHVDAAYGGFFYLTVQGKAKLEGMELADSLVLDPHKGLFQPYGLGAVLVRQAGDLKDSLKFDANYLRDVADSDLRSPNDYSPELTRHFRAARLWFSLKIHGLARFRAALEEKLTLASYAHEKLKAIPGIVVGPAPQLSIATFRVAGEGDAADTATDRLMGQLLKRGRVHLSSTKLRGQVHLRLCVLCFRSHRKEVDEALAEIQSQL